MTTSIRDILAGQSTGDRFDRTAELAALERCLDSNGPLVTWLHGLGGVGKSLLLDRFCQSAQKSQVRTVLIDCRIVEPTAAGLLAALSEILERAIGQIPDAVAALSGERVVLAFDNYHVFRLADSWLRREFIPSLDQTVRVIMVSREPPTPGWVSAREWQAHFSAVLLNPLQDRDDEVLASHLFDEVREPALKEALEAAAVVRRINRPMLAALCPDCDADALYEQLAGLSFVERRRDGLAIQDVARDLIGARLLAADPDKYRHCQKAAWRLLRQQLQESSRADLWRCTADIIYLLENPVIREAFFPSESAPVSVEPAGANDRQAILDIARAHEPTSGLKAMKLWWANLPNAFHAIRDSSGDIVGFYCVALPSDVGASWMQQDPVGRIWQNDLARRRDRRSGALFIRRWLSRDDGEAPCAAQAAAWIDIKRTYLELRPELRRVYLTLQDISPYAAAATELGFAVLDDVPGTGADAYYSAMLDFGPGSVDGWICNLLAAELGVTDDRLLDTAARELVIGEHRIALTPLEYGVVSMLESRVGDAVSRSELLTSVWGQDFDGGSNVVDAVIKGLRRKCGDRADLIETVRGVGFRLRA